jgi:chitinase
VSSDLYSDLQKPFPGAAVNWTTDGTSAGGCIGSLFELKQQNRHLKVLLSIGGWTYSEDGKFNVSSTEAGRQRFATSAVKLMSDWGFDGLDIDWEYPKNRKEGKDFVLLLRECRKALDDYAAKHKQDYHYELTVAVSAGPQHYKLQDLESMDHYLDAWHLMSYDYSGAWDDVAGHQANLWADPRSKVTVRFSTDQAIRDYTSRGVPSTKIILGVPLYGRSFANAGGIGKSFSGAGSDAGSGTQGIVLYKDIPQDDSKNHYDATLGATYYYDPISKELISYDDPRSAKQKARYIEQVNLGGAFYWDATGDREGSDSLVGIMAKSFQDRGSKPSRFPRNMLVYPDSPYKNIQNGTRKK